MCSFDKLLHYNFGLLIFTHSYLKWHSSHTFLLTNNNVMYFKWFEIFNSFWLENFSSHCVGNERLLCIKWLLYCFINIVWCDDINHLKFKLRNTACVPSWRLMCTRLSSGYQMFRGLRSLEYHFPSSKVSLLLFD